MVLCAHFGLVLYDLFVFLSFHSLMGFGPRVLLTGFSIEVSFQYSFDSLIQPTKTVGGESLRRSFIGFLK